MMEVGWCLLLLSGLMVAPIESDMESEVVFSGQEYKKWFVSAIGVKIDDTSVPPNQSSSGESRTVLFYLP